MQNNELETIAAAMQDALHRAYALGRSDALRRVVEMVQSDELGSKTVALLSHSEPSVVEASQAAIESSAPPRDVSEDEPTQRDGHTRSDGAHNDNAEAATPEREHARPTASVKDFLLDYLYPLGAKK